MLISYFVSIMSSTDPDGPVTYMFISSSSLVNITSVLSCNICISLAMFGIAY